MPMTRSWSAECGWGQGGLIFTVTPASGDSPDEEERLVKMTTGVRLRKRGRSVSR
jgi:hypothetical protein